MAYAKLSEQERVSLLMMRGWGDRVRSYNEVRVLFNRTFRNGDGLSPVSKSTVERTVRRFMDNGTVKDLERSGRPKSVASEEKQIEIAQAFVENPYLSLRRAGNEHDVSHETVRKVLKSIHFHPYKIHLVQELNEDDPDRRIEFSETMMNRIDEDPLFLYNIVFSDEATFTLKGEVNRHNCRYWSETNPAWMLDSHTQYPQKLNVWAGILNDTLIGPFFINGNLNAGMYEQLLRNQIIPRIREIAGNNYDDTWFQQDGAAPHYGRDVRAYLDTQFPHKWIGRRGEIEWPARSPDLTPLDYFLWGYLKSKVYATQPQNLDELRNRIMQEAALIDRVMIRNAVSHFYNRIAFCQEAQGLQFEHLR
jgi:transposase